MEEKVVGAQNISRMCMVCGQENDFSLKARFLDLDDGQVAGVFTPKAEHQSYPGRLHGGVSSAILDETIGRAINVGTKPDEEPVWGVTIELTIKYRKPVPLDGEIHAVGRIDKQTSRTFEGSGEIVLEDGSVAVEAHGVYVKLPDTAIAEDGMDEKDWFEDPRDTPKEVAF